MKRFYLFLSCFLSIGFLAKSYTIVPVTGFNADVICNGTGLATTSSSTDVDGGGYDFISADFLATLTSVPPTQYLPNNGLINSVNTSGLQFQLAGYSTNNTLRLTGTSNSTLTVTTPLSAINIYVLGATGSGTSTATFTVTFTDNTTQTFTNVGFQDWYSGTGFAIAQVGRVNRTTSVLDAVSTTGPRLYESVLALSSTNWTKQIASINVARTGGNSTTSVLNVVAISVQDPCSGTPAAGTATTTATNACTGTPFTLALTGNSGSLGITYQWQSSSSASGPWANVGAVLTTPSFTTNASATTYYRCGVICANSNITSYSSVVQVTVPAPMPGGTYTINSGAPTAGTNFHSFADAINAIGCGIAGPIVFSVVPGSGPYVEQPVVPQIGNSSAINTVTFNGNNEILTFTPTATNNAVFALNGADYIRIKKLTVNVNATASYGIGILLTNDADNNIIDSCTISAGVTSASTIYAGIALTGSLISPITANSLCDSTTISNNTITGGYYGVSFSGAAATPMFNTKVINNVIKEFYNYGIYGIYASGFLMEGNDVHRLTRTNLSLAIYYGVRISNALGIKISKNKFHDPFTGTPAATANTFGINLNLCTATAAQPNEVSNNAIYNLSGNNYQYGIYCFSSGYTNFYFNTFISDNQSATTPNPTIGMFQYNNSGQNNFQNNIIYITRGGTGIKYGAYFTTSNFVVSNRNDYYINSTASANYIAFYNNTNIATLAAYQTAAGSDANSITLNPNFVAPATGNFSPSNLAMDNIGTPITGIPTDITGFGRNYITPDAGAIEFNNCTDPSGLSVSAVTSTSVTVNWSAIAGVAGYQYIVDANPAAPTVAGTATTAVSAGITGLTAFTIYYLHVSTDCGGGGISNWVTIPFKTCLAANITAGGTTTFCTGASVVLNAPTPPTGSVYTYQWLRNNTNLPGSTTASITTAIAGNYTVFVTNTTANCTATTAVPTTVIVGAPPASAITPAGAIGLCLNATDTLVTNPAPGLVYQWFNNTVAIPGATNGIYYATTPGSYTVSVTSGPGCSATTATPTVVNYFTQPTASATVTGGVPVICTGSTQTLNAGAGTGYIYQWISNGNIIPNATSTSYTTAAAGIYKITVKDGNGCRDTSAAINLTIVPLPIATVSPSAPTSGCDSVVLTAIGSNLTYQWNFANNPVIGATASTYQANATGNYSVKIKDANNCFNTSPNTAVTIYPSPASAISYTSPLAFCFGGAVALQCSIPQATGISYQWLMNSGSVTGATSQTYVAAVNGGYSVAVTNQYGCTKVSPAVSVTVYPVFTPPIFVSNDTLTTNTYASYQWYRNGQPIAGANSQLYIFNQNGVYYVSVQDFNGCYAPSPNKSVNNVGINNTPLAKEINVYPNPATDYIEISAPVDVDVEIRDMNGRVVMSAQSGKKINVQSLPNGIYTVVIADKKGTVIKIDRVTKM